VKCPYCQAAAGDVQVSDSSAVPLVTTATSIPPSPLPQLPLPVSTADLSAAGPVANDQSLHRCGDDDDDDDDFQPLRSKKFRPSIDEVSGPLFLLQWLFLFLL